MNTPLTILVTAVSGTNTGTQVLQALSAKPEKYRTVTTDISPHAFGATLSDAFYLVPPANAPDYMTTLLEICSQEKVQAVVPGSEPELAKLVRERHHLQERSIALLANNQEVIEACQDKMKTIRFLANNGFLFLPTAVVDLQAPPEETVSSLMKTLRLPLVLKPYLGTGGSNNIHIAQDKEELGLILKLLKHSGLQLIAQEYQGSPEEEYTVGVMSGPDGQAFSSFALKRRVTTSLTRKLHIKNRSQQRIKDPYLTISSGISEGWVGDYPEIRSYAQMVANALGSTGPLNIQCRKTEQGVQIFEINPRFSGTTSIRALCGHNDLDLIIRSHLLKENLSQTPYKYGLVIRALYNTLLETDDGQG